ncbi:MAG: arginine--tRNA ligase, partial [Bacteroidota bacterium]
MNLLHDDIKKGLAQLIQEGFKAMEVEESLENIYAQISISPKLNLGHFAYPLFPFAKTLRNAPAKIAAELASNLPESDLFEKAEPAGPYLNFTLSQAKLGELAAQPILDGSFFQRNLTKGAPKTMIEYSQPNTHKELHVGHMRNLALGDALIRMHRYCDFDIVSATFPGDVGTHVAKCLWYMKHHNTEAVPETDKGAWLGTMYSRASIKLADEKETEKNTENQAAITEILKQLEAKEGEYFDLWKETREWSVALMKQVYGWADVEFDAWYWESDVDSPSVALAKELFAEGKLIESDGAIGMDLEEDKLGFAMLLKRDGTGLYLTKDVDLAKRKFEDYEVKKSVYVVDKRQKHHFQQVFKVLEKLGFEQAKDCYHLQYDYVELPDGPMSSRKGNVVPIMDLIEQMEAAISNNYLTKSVENGILTQEETQAVAEIVAKGAIKYGMIRIDTTKKIVFEMDKWIDIKGDSGPYQQYTYARIKSLCRKQGFDPNG